MNGQIQKIIFHKSKNNRHRFVGIQVSHNEITLSPDSSLFGIELSVRLRVVHIILVFFFG